MFAIFSIFDNSKFPTRIIDIVSTSGIFSIQRDHYTKQNTSPFVWLQFLHIEILHNWTWTHFHRFNAVITQSSEALRIILFSQLHNRFQIRKNPEMWLKGWKLAECRIVETIPNQQEKLKKWYLVCIICLSNGLHTSSGNSSGLKFSVTWRV